MIEQQKQSGSLMKRFRGISQLMILMIVILQRPTSATTCLLTWNAVAG